MINPQIPKECKLVISKSRTKFIITIITQLPNKTTKPQSNWWPNIAKAQSVLEISSKKSAPEPLELRTPQKKTIRNTHHSIFRSIKHFSTACVPKKTTTIRMRLHGHRTFLGEFPLRVTNEGKIFSLLRDQMWKSCLMMFDKSLSIFLFVFSWPFRWHQDFLSKKTGQRDKNTAYSSGPVARPRSTTYFSNPKAIWNSCPPAGGCKHRWCRSWALLAVANCGQEGL